MKLHPTGLLLWPDNKRVVVRPFISMDPTRVQHIIARALALSEQETEKQLSLVRADFSERHVDLNKSWLRHFEKVRAQIPDDETISEPRRLFIGARSEEHTSELQSRGHLVCRLLLEKKKK